MVTGFANELESALEREDREALVRGLDRLVKAALTLDARAAPPRGV